MKGSIRDYAFMAFVRASLVLGAALGVGACAADAGDGPKSDSSSVDVGVDSGGRGAAFTGDSGGVGMVASDDAGAGVEGSVPDDAPGRGTDAGTSAPCGSCPLNVAYYTKDAPGTASTQTVSFDLAIGNPGTSPQVLSDLEVRYFFTAEGASNLVMKSYYAPGAVDMQVTGSFTPMTSTSRPPRTASADTYLEIGFTPAAGGIAPSGSTGDIQIAFFDSTYASRFDETNDYSFTAADTPAVCSANDALTCPSTTLALYRRGVLVWGAEPR